MDAKAYRALARKNLSSNWPLSIGTGILVCLMGGLLTGTNFMPEFEFRIENQNIESIRDFLLVLWDYGGVYLTTASGLGILQFLIGGTVQLGYARYLLDQHDGKKLEFNLSISRFNRFADGFLQRLLRGVFVFLWGLLLVIPGIVAFFSYAMTPFIMEENPNLTPLEAITASKRLMRGHKGELFILELSFIGWSILCGLTANIGYIALNPYKNAAYAAFYRDITRLNPGIRSDDPWENPPN